MVKLLNMRLVHLGTRLMSVRRHKVHVADFLLTPPSQAHLLLLPVLSSGCRVEKDPRQRPMEEECLRHYVRPLISWIV